MMPAERVCAADDPRWPAERQRGVTATDIVAVLGLSPHESAYSLYLRKRGFLDGDGDSDRFRLGRYLESYAEARWAEEHGAGPEAAGALKVTSGGLWRSLEHERQLATPDRVILRLTEVAAGDGYVSQWQPDGPLELKSWADAGRSQWAAGIPAAVRAQLLWQMDTLGLDRGYAGVVFLPSGEFRSYMLEHQEDGDVPCAVCADQKLMREAGAEFWRRVAHGDAPSVDGSAATLAALRGLNGDVRADKRAVVDGDLWDHYAALKAMARTVGRDLREAEARIREVTGEAAEIAARYGETEELVGRRLRYLVTEKTVRKPYWRDYLTLLDGKGDDDE